MSQPDPPTLTNRLGTLASKMFVTTSAMQFSDLLEEFRVEARAQFLTEAIDAIRAAAGPYPDGNWQEGDGPDPTQVGMHDAAAVLAGLLAAARPSGDR